MEIKHLGIWIYVGKHRPPNSVGNVLYTNYQRARLIALKPSVEKILKVVVLSEAVVWSVVNPVVDWDRNWDTASRRVDRWSRKVTWKFVFEHRKDPNLE